VISARLRAGLAVPTLFALCAFLNFAALGTWQLQRRTWKLELIDTMEQRLSAAPVPLPPEATWRGLAQSAHEFERVTFSAKFAHNTYARVYGIGSALRSDISGPGYWIFTPARLPDGGTVVVDRGFVPDTKAASITEPPDALVEMTGVLRWPQPRSLFAPADPGHNVWFARDQLAIAAGKGWGEVAPFYVDLESPITKGLPAPTPLQVNLRNDHLQYAITWFGLAAVVLVMFVFWVRSRVQSSRP
jgi:cytochrome oxidase assembly protein ShyY1